MQRKRERFEAFSLQLLCGKYGVSATSVRFGGQGGGPGVAHIDVRGVNLERRTEDGQKLDDVGQLPHVPDALQQRRLLVRQGIIAVHLIDGALPGGSHGWNRRLERPR